MCMEDLRMGQQSRSYMVITTFAGAGSTRVLPANPRRTAVILGPASGQNVFYNFGAAPTTLGDGILIGTSQPIILNIQDHGGLCCDEIWASLGAAGTVSVGVTEYAGAMS